MKNLNSAPSTPFDRIRSASPLRQEREYRVRILKEPPFVWSETLREMLLVIPRKRRAEAVSQWITQHEYAASRNKERQLCWTQESNMRELQQHYAKIVAMECDRPSDIVIQRAELSRTAEEIRMLKGRISSEDTGIQEIDSITTQDRIYSNVERNLPEGECIAITPAPSSGPTPAPKRSWSIRQPKRGDPLAWQLFQTLKAALRADEKLPSARKLLDEWGRSPPVCVVNIVDDEVSYQNSKGKIEVVSLDNLRNRIKRMTSE